MTIDEARTALGKERKYALHENKQAFDIAIDTMKKYQMMQADYENRLKADMVAMLTEIQLEIEELDYFDGEEPINITQELMDEVKNWEYGVKDCKKIIQQKIDKLKENT